MYLISSDKLRYRNDCNTVSTSNISCSSGKALYFCDISILILKNHNMFCTMNNLNLSMYTAISMQNTKAVKGIIPSQNCKVFYSIAQQNLILFFMRWLFMAFCEFPLCFHLEPKRSATQAHLKGKGLETQPVIVHSHAHKCHGPYYTIFALISIFEHCLNMGKVGSLNSNSAFKESLHWSQWTLKVKGSKHTPQAQNFCSPGRTSTDVRFLVNMLMNRVTSSILSTTCLQF